MKTAWYILISRRAHSPVAGYPPAIRRRCGADSCNAVHRSSKPAALHLRRTQTTHPSERARRECEGGRLGDEADDEWARQARGTEPGPGARSSPGPGIRAVAPVFRGDSGPVVSTRGAREGAAISAARAAALVFLPPPPNWRYIRPVPNPPHPPSLILSAPGLF
ncbi:hypothetical protein SKAU_G00001300 [Synaphobranchus kaupii]|uniref:Uncharacterized protein n=1 Tax=Synaphobranchus kaupii TaxID=118154 RepID=A0A9Q1G9Y5_SYNKA|nr:hypothetical protein SKAU_G00001300 [Synaphobranchus kaupii]